MPAKPGTNFGQSGTYLYRYQLLQTIPGTATKNVVICWFTDPFAHATDVGELTAFVTPGSVADFVWTDDAWKVPELKDQVVYELHVEEFNSTFDGVIERLPYLKSLGVTCLELMPITSLKLDFDLGYGPLHYFALCERWGGVLGLKRLVNACHHAGVAVILDVVYQHVDATFPYHLIYENAGLPSPMIRGSGSFGPEIDFSQEFAREYVQAANVHWLHEYHVDGFRYDEVTDLYDGPTGMKYAKIAFDVYDESLRIPLFTPSGGVATGEYSRVIQDESFVQLPDTRSVGYPDTKAVHDIANDPVDMPVAPFRYLESHDHSQLMCFVGELPGDVPFGDRSKYYKLQPFAIALHTCQGTPMLWQGQEFADNYFLPDQGNGRICFRRDVNWEYFYDDFGVPLVRLYRILGTLRYTCPALHNRESFFYNTQSRTGDGIVAYRRQSTVAKQIAMVFLSFSDEQQLIAVPFPEPGSYRERIDDVRSTPLEIAVGSANQLIMVDVLANYGYLFIK